MKELKGLKISLDKLLRLFLLCVLCCTLSTAYSQVGCNRSIIEANADLFDVCEVFDSCLVCTVNGGGLFIFNLDEYGICTSMIAYVDYKSDQYLRVVQAFDCRSMGWSTSLSYDRDANLAIFKMSGR